MSVTILMLLAAAQAQQPMIVPGEVLVKFAPASPVGRAVARTAEAGAADLKDLDAAVQALILRPAVPLAAARVQSGGWAVLKISEPRLHAGLAERFRGRSCVAEATVIRREGGAEAIRVAFRPGTSQARIVAAGDAARVDSLVARFASDFATPLTGRVAEGALLVEVDLAAFTLRAVERLKALPDVEEAQPNHRVRGFGPRTP